MGTNRQSIGKFGSLARGEGEVPRATWGKSRGGSSIKNFTERYRKSLWIIHEPGSVRGVYREVHSMIDNWLTVRGDHCRDAPVTTGKKWHAGRTKSPLILTSTIQERQEESPYSTSNEGDRGQVLLPILLRSSGHPPKNVQSQSESARATGGEIKKGTGIAGTK